MENVGGSCGLWGGGLGTLGAGGGMWLICKFPRGGGGGGGWGLLGLLEVCG